MSPDPTPDDGIAAWLTAPDATQPPADLERGPVAANRVGPDLAELRRLRDTEREELHSPTRRLDAYYYSFNETGSVPIDAILSAVAIAGKSCHNTNMWSEDGEWSRWGVGRSLVDVIQCAANEAAAERDALAAKVERVRVFAEQMVSDCDDGYGDGYELRPYARELLTILDADLLRALDEEPQP